MSNRVHVLTAAGPEDAEGRQHDADTELERVLGDPRERRVHEEAGEEHGYKGGRGTERRQSGVVKTSSVGTFGTKRRPYAVSEFPDIQLDFLLRPIVRSVPGPW